MDKSNIIKIIIAVVIGILAVIYYFMTKETTTYENILSSNVVVTNEITNQTADKTQKVSTIKVYVAGEVNTPGVIELEEGARVEDAIEGAGGITSEANLINVNLAYEVSDGEKIYIPNISEEIEEESSEVVSDGSSSTTSSSSNSKININKATVAELTSIPGIGEATAEKIISYREENGKFQSIEDIKNVSGIGDSKYENMKDYISVK